MTAEPQWAGWRDANHQTPRHESLHPQLSGTQATHSGLKDSLAQPWYSTSQEQAQQYSYDSRRPSQTYNTQQSQYAQPDSQAQGGNYFPPTSTPFSNGAIYSGTWRSDPSQETSTIDRRGADAPLSLQIPSKAQDLPNLAHGYTTPRSDAPLYSSGTSSWSHQTTSLPSFAALSEQATRTDEPDEVEIAPMSARLSCTQCTKLGPLCRDLAIAVAELDSDLATHCNTNALRSTDLPNTETTMRTVQWILDRVRYMKRDMQDLTRHGAVDSSRRQPQSLTHYTNPLKRTAEQWDQEDLPTLKLPRPNTSWHDAPHGDRRTSVDFATSHPLQRSAYSPAPSDSAPGSAYPRPGSPISGRLPRALPSPSSLAFPPSGPASFVPANAASIGSPGTSYNPGSSIHAVSTNSATSAHLQDLQHQVSLKSLALQTLQTEYATLLQKLQRERIKSQTIEKKTTVADQEVNDLTTRNEELSEQIRILESQLQDCERKRDAEREDAAKEKEQWGRMLDMSGRLQNKSAADYQRIAKEKVELLRRLASYETDESQHGGRGTSLPRQIDLSQPSFRSPTPNTGNEVGAAQRDLAAVAESTDLDALRTENMSLRARIALLQSSLEELRRQYGEVEETIENLISRRTLLRKTLDQVTGNEAQTQKETQAEAAAKDDFAATEPNSSSASTQRNSVNAPRVVTGSSGSQPVLSSSSNARPDDSRQVDPLSRENLAHIARAVSPGPAELGFHVQPSTSSPEELIRALGPVPAPLPPMRFSQFPYEDPRHSQFAASRQSRRQSQPFIAAVSSPQDPDGTLPRIPSFRPLAYQESGSLFGSSPQSHHSSPGPNLSNSSSPSSTSTHSPEYKGVGRGAQEYTRRHSQPYVAISRSTAAMPPPPRPLP